ncbi:hypothetical protein SDRG_02356 [Saprolegnia diclina VS20]|uniref:RING-type domain-containing protein n=1 Tax=Saprolegnia diclina (strain VS20) TaxID=1156394 RepID=T0SCF3_SAPDV|nr:hypothetical protein SDRG_02356 [Saprolegnia diclina VS20]EQC40462.1 hypothetical protein SDRG_02356 [Saprolegnia diclina VS20]|eukprot:XP_008606161.1 hypothetical protein SDRG_02356 [Saprolegnia diclina VS20]
MDAELRRLLGKPPASRELKRALEPDLYMERVDLIPGTQSVPDFVATNAPLSGDRLQHALYLASIDIPLLDELYLPFLAAFFDLGSLQSLAIPAFAASRRHLLLQPIPGSAAAVHIANVMEIAHRQLPAQAAGLIILTTLPLRGQDRALVPSMTTCSSAGKPVHLLTLPSPALNAPTIERLLGAFLSLVGIQPCGLYHCVSQHCSQPTLALCPLCLRKLSLVIPHFNVVRRYEALVNVCKTVPDEWARSLHQWCLDRLSFITNGSKGGGDATLDDPPAPSKPPTRCAIIVAMDSIDLDDIELTFDEQDASSTVLELLRMNTGATSAGYNFRLLADAHQSWYPQPRPALRRPCGTQRRRSHSLPSALPVSMTAPGADVPCSEVEPEPEPLARPPSKQPPTPQQRLQECLVRNMALTQAIAQKSKEIERHALIVLQLQQQLDHAEARVQYHVDLATKMEKRLALANERTRVTSEGYVTLKQRLNGLRVELAATTKDNQRLRGKNVPDLSFDDLEALEATLEASLCSVRDGLKAQYRAAMEARSDLCIVCYSEPVSIVLLPCRHRVLCGACAVRVATCPVDRHEITDMLSTFGHAA